MSRRAATAADTTGAVRLVGAIVFVLALTLVVLLLVNARPAPDPFDPRSGRPDGARGLVVTLESVGAVVNVSRTAPEPSTAGRVLVLDDRLDDEQRSALLDFVDAGGVLVVADPDSALHGGAGVDGGAIAVTGGRLDPERRTPVASETNISVGDCTIGALDGLRGLTVPDGLLFPVGPTEPRCFTDDRPAAASGAVPSFVVVREIGAGVVVGLGDNELFTNRWLRGADNAGLAAGLLVPGDGAAVTILLGTGAAPSVEDIGSGEDTLRDLIPPWVWMAMVLGAASFVVFSISRATRLGRVLAEPEVTPIAGSELVVATGNLMERAGHDAQAGWLLRRRLHRDLSVAFGVDLDAPLTELDRVVADRAGTQIGEVERLLADQTSGESALVRTATHVRSIRHRALGPARSGHTDHTDPTDHPGDAPVPDEEFAR